MSRIALPSAAMRTALYAFALSAALLGGRRWPAWAALAAFVLSLAWLTGNRADSVLLLLAAPIAAGCAATLGRGLAGPALRLAAVGVAAVVLTAVLAQALTPFDYDFDRATGRLEAAAGLSIDREEDSSLQHRKAETNLAWRLFLSNPVLGMGPGHLFEWTTVTGLARSSFHVDTTLSFAAKFGAVGILALSALAFAFARFLRRGWRQARDHTANVALATFAGVIVLGAPVAASLEDKGFSFGLIMLLALALFARREQISAEEPVGGSPA